MLSRRLPLWLVLALLMLALPGGGFAVLLLLGAQSERVYTIATPEKKTAFSLLSRMGRGRSWQTPSFFKASATNSSPSAQRS